jgi:hypothetical protein
LTAAADFNVTGGNNFAVRLNGDVMSFIVKVAEISRYFAVSVKRSVERAVWIVSDKSE